MIQSIERPRPEAPLSATVLDVKGLRVAYLAASSFRIAVEGADFRIGTGEVVAIVGESGSGKSTIAQAIMGLLPTSGIVEAGSILVNGQDIVRWPDRRLQAMRGAVVSLVPQDPGNSLNPVKTIGKQVAEILAIHQGATGPVAYAQAISLLERVGLDQPRLRAQQYPHELSGGMKQRALIAIAIALRPALIIADEPTSALDVTVQRHILDLIDDLRREFGTSVLLITHDLGIAADRADRIIVMRRGVIEEQGRAADILKHPANPYTKQLFADAPSLGSPTARALPSPAFAPARATDAIIRVEGLTQNFRLAGKNADFRAVDDVSFDVARGTTHALVGESGSGKTTTIRIITGFQKPTAGRVVIDAQDISELHGEALRQFRRKIQLVYQNPFASLDPRQSVFDIIEEPLLNFEAVRKEQRAAKVAGLIQQVGLPADVAQRRPHALSGGQRQRVAIARALVLDPEILVLDEAVSALDVTIQAQILSLLDVLQRDLGLTYLFVSHDLSVVRQIADTVSVLHGGKLVESGPVEQVFGRPASAYTRELIAAIPGRRHQLPGVPGANSGAG
ncbi:MAG: ABC transporter ATP-binding protein [Pantoea sp.]|uniref:dipeptide ABC transporter ATP-binding protein n=1 Tax=Pantoea sp. TaxID=69393 RepID=UPI0023940A86|nr:ABC transporter ATP-binding protein [Pantoea sp.]MDE1187106.1 ABC transporter ATP-binding protein [Pantoea sp.]